MAQFLQTVEECKSLTTTRKVLAPLPTAQREVDPSELQRLDDYIDRMRDIFMRSPRGQLDFLTLRQKPDSTQGSTERGKKRSARSKNKAKARKVDFSTTPVTVTQENERVTPSGPNE
uniref:Uncharacterized protein n=1 Tax=Heliothis virescens TaxID=7102 RepID=A0A2A4JB04_HELVI